MAAISRALLLRGYSLLVGWYRLNERVADYWNLSRRLSVVMLLVASLLCWALATAITEEAWVSAGAIVFVACVLPLMALFPEWTVVAVAVMISSVMSPLMWDALPLFTRGFSLPNTLLMYGTAVVFLRQVATWSPLLKRWVSPMSITLFLFLVLIVPVGLFYHTVFTGFSERPQLAEMQHMLTWLVYFILIGALTTERRLHALIGGVLFVAVLGCTATVLQGIVGERALFFLKLGEKDIRIEYSEGLLRVLPPGMLHCLAAIVGWRMAAATSGARQWAWLGLSFLAMAALVFTQLRHLWVFVGLGILMAWWFSEGRAKFILALIGVLLVTLVASAVILLRPVSSATRDDFFASIHRRWESTFEEGSQEYSTSLGARRLEILEISEQWSQSPIFGIGWGKPYRVEQRYDPYVDSMTYDFDAYIHNSFWWALGKSGIVGAFAVVLLWVVGIVRGYQLQRRATEPGAKAWLQALWISYIVYVFSAQLHPVFWVNKNIVAVAIVLGLMEVISDFASRRSQPATQSALQSGRNGNHFSRNLQKL